MHDPGAAVGAPISSVGSPPVRVASAVAASSSAAAAAAAERIAMQPEAGVFS
eukprot:COSAG04_NODE_1985_length_5073_cov_2.626257_2_plen_52_part_00